MYRRTIIHKINVERYKGRGNDSVLKILSNVGHRLADYAYNYIMYVTRIPKLNTIHVCAFIKSVDLKLLSVIKIT